MSPEATRTARELQMLEGLVDCAYGLATTFAAAAKAEADTRHGLELLEGFHKSALAVRMGIRLCMTLRAPPKAAPAMTAERAEALEHERAEHEPAERPERDERERERERDYEPVSLPKFLSTLGVVARDAARLGDRLPAGAADVLPTLQNLLARANSDPPVPQPAPSPRTGVAVLARSPPPCGEGPGVGLQSSPRGVDTPTPTPPRRGEGLTRINPKAMRDGPAPENRTRRLLLGSAATSPPKPGGRMGPPWSGSS